MTINGYSLFFICKFINKETNNSEIITSKPLNIETLGNRRYILSLQHPFNFCCEINDINSEKNTILFLLCATKMTKEEHTILEITKTQHYKIIESFTYDNKKIYDNDNIPTHYFDSKLAYDTNILYDVFNNLLPYLVIKKIIKYLDLESWIEINIRSKTQPQNSYFIINPHIKIPDYIYYRHLS